MKDGWRRTGARRRTDGRKAEGRRRRTGRGGDRVGSGGTADLCAEDVGERDRAQPRLHKAVQDKVLAVAVAFAGDLSLGLLVVALVDLGRHPSGEEGQLFSPIRHASSFCRGRRAG